MTRWIDTALAAWVRLPVPARVLVPLAVMAFLWWSSSRQLDVQEANPVRAVLHNGAHVVAYAALAGSLLLALVRAGEPPSRRRAVVMSFVLAVAYGAIDEWHQSFVPGRVCSIADLMTDAAGSVLALLLLRGRLGDDRASWRAVAATVLVCLLCVAFATWGPL